MPTISFGHADSIVERTGASSKLHVDKKTANAYCLKIRTFLFIKEHQDRPTRSR